MANKNQLNLIDDIGSIKNCKLAIFTTYSFDAIFFENVLLRDIKRNNPWINIVVLVDANHYPEASSQTTATGTEYLLIPVATSLFHPKIFLFLSEKSSVAYIGSHNITPSGITHNLELTYKTEEKALICDCVTYFEELFSRILGKENVINETLLRFESKLKSDEEKSNDTHLIDNLRQPILKTTLDYLRKLGPFSNVTIFAPFWSNEIELLRQINNATKPMRIDVCVQKMNHNLNVDDVSTLQYVSVKEVVSKEERFMHSKFIIFRGTQDFVLVGSPNFTDPALNKTCDNGNVELAILLPLDNESNIFGELSYRDITADDVRNSRRDDTLFSAQTGTNRVLAILMANTNSIGQLQLTVTPIDDEKKLTLVIDGPITVEKIATTVAPEENTKVFNVRMKGPTTVWFEENGQVASNKIRVYNPEGEYATLIRYQTDVHALPKLIADTKDLEGILQIIAALFPEEMQSRGESGTRFPEPSPGKLQGTTTASSVLDILLEFLRIPRGSVSPPSGSQRPRETGTREEGEYEGHVETTYNYPAIFNKWTRTFTALKLAFDNSLINYIAYALISLKLIDIFSKLDKPELRERLLNQLMGNICYLISAYHISKVTAEDTLSFVSIVFYLKTQTLNSTTSLQDFGIDGRITANLPEVENLISPIEDPASVVNLKNNVLARLHELKLALDNENELNKMIASAVSLVILRKSRELRWEITKKLIDQVSEIHDDFLALIGSHVLQFLIAYDDENRSDLKDEIDRRLATTTLRFFRRTLYNDVLNIIESRQRF
jgi:HKD family nuclease